MHAPVLAGFVVALAGVAWPVTAATMMLLGEDPVAVLTASPNEPPNT